MTRDVLQHKINDKRYSSTTTILDHRLETVSVLFIRI